MPLELTEVAAMSLGFVVAGSWHDALGTTLKSCRTEHPIWFAVVVTLLVLLIVALVDWSGIAAPAPGRPKKIVHFQPSHAVHAAHPAPWGSAGAPQRA